MKWVDSPNKAPEHDEPKALRGRLQAMKAADWIRKHPDTFDKLCAIVAQLPSDHLRDRVNLACIERGIKLTDSNVAVSFAHSMWAPLTRYMVIAHPELMNNPVTFASACVDHSGLPEIPEIGATS